LTVNVAANLFHSAQSARHTQAAGTFNRLTHNESSQKLGHEFSDNTEIEHGADDGAGRRQSKDGKTRPPARHGKSANFSRLCKSKLMG